LQGFQDDKGRTLWGLQLDRMVSLQEMRSIYYKERNGYLIRGIVFVIIGLLLLLKALVSISRSMENHFLSYHRLLFWFAADIIPIKDIVFSLRGKEKGLQDIEINFLQKGTLLDKLIVSSIVVGSIEEKDFSRADTTLVNGDWIKIPFNMMFF
jgi:hypothetical protein